MTEQVSRYPRTGDEMQWEVECLRDANLRSLMVSFKDRDQWARLGKVLHGLDGIYDEMSRPYDWEKDGEA
jgi:hypothetical protein